MGAAPIFETGQKLMYLTLIPFIYTKCNFSNVSELWPTLEVAKTTEENFFRGNSV